jgi:hypothetical protein
MIAGRVNDDLDRRRSSPGTIPSVQSPFEAPRTGRLTQCGGVRAGPAQLAGRPAHAAQAKWNLCDKRTVSVRCNILSRAGFMAFMLAPQMGAAATADATAEATAVRESN